MKKVLLILSVCAFIIPMCYCHPNVESALSCNNKNRYLYLVAGIDDSAENTDVLFTLGYDVASSTLYVAQIPRDTYFAFGEAQNKINQIYPVCRMHGDDKMTALSKTAEYIEKALGVKFDGAFAITVSGFKKTVDQIGGVDITLPSDMTVFVDDGDKLFLKAGSNHINGNDAEKFVRYRKGYITGDLGRIDAQKIFLNALISKITKDLSLVSMFDIMSAIRDDVITNVKITESLPLLINTYRTGKDKKVFFSTLPGEAAQSNTGLSFYVLNRKSTAEIAKRYMFSELEFDKERVFLKTDDEEFKKIYESDSIGIREYSDNELSIN